MSDKAVTGYWSTQKVCEYFGGISSRTLNRWKNRSPDPFPKASHGGVGAKSLYSVKEVLNWDERNQVNS